MYPPTLAAASAVHAANQSNSSNASDLTQSASSANPTPAHRPASPPRYSLKTRLIHLRRRASHGLEVLAASVLPILPNRGVRGTVQIGSRTVSYYRHWPTSDAALIPAWEQLCKDVPDSTVFQSPAWQQAIALVPDALGTLRLVTVHDGDRLTGVFPFERRWGGHWRTNGLSSTAYHDPLVHPDNAADTWDAALRAVTQLGGGCRSLSFDLVSPHGDLIPRVSAVAKAAGFADVKVTPASVGTTVALADTWDKYLANLGSHDRKELRRKIRKVEEKGAGRLVVNDTEESVQKSLPQVLELMSADAGGKGRRARWLYGRHFDVAAAPLARTGRLVVYQLLVEDKLASSIISLPHGNHQLLWNGAMNDALREWSPGIVILGMIFRRAIEQGQLSIDLLRGNFPYKFSLGAVEHPMSKLTLVR